MSKYEPSQGEKMADLASQAFRHAMEQTRNTLSPEDQRAGQVHVDLSADMAAKAADQLKAEGR